MLFAVAACAGLSAAVGTIASVPLLAVLPLLTLSHVFLLPPTPKKHAQPSQAAPYYSAPGLEPGCTWPRCILPSLSARLGSGSSSSSSSSGGTGAGSGHARSIVPGAVAAPSGIPGRVELPTSRQWQPQQLQQQQQQQRETSAERNNGRSARINGAGGSARSSGVNGSSNGATASSSTQAAATANQQNGKQASSSSSRRDGLLIEIQEASTFWELQAIWQRAAKSSSYSNHSSSSDSKSRKARSSNRHLNSRGSQPTSGGRTSLQTHHIVALLRRLAECVLGGPHPQQLPSLDKPEQGQRSSSSSSKRSSPTGSSPVETRADGEGEDWEGSWQSPSRAQDVGLASWDGGDAWGNRSSSRGGGGSSSSSSSKWRGLPGSPRGSVDRPAGTTMFGAETSTSGRGLGAGPSAGKGWGPSSPRSSIDGFELQAGLSSSRPVAGGTSNGKPQRRLWPDAGVEPTQLQGAIARFSQQQQPPQQQQPLEKGAEKQFLSEELEQEWEQQQAALKRERELGAVQAQTSASPSPPPLEAPQQAQPAARAPKPPSWPSPSSALRRPPPRTEALIAQASRDSGDSPTASPVASMSVSSLDGYPKAPADSNASNDDSGDGEPAAAAAAPAVAAAAAAASSTNALPAILRPSAAPPSAAPGATTADSLTGAPLSPQPQQREPSGNLLTSEEMSARAARFSGSMTRAYGSRAATYITRAGKGRAPPPTASQYIEQLLLDPAAKQAARTPSPEDVEALLQELLCAVRARAAWMSPHAAASALRSLCELRQDDVPTVRALLAGPLSPARLVALQPQGGSGGSKSPSAAAAAAAATLGGVAASLAVLNHLPPPAWLSATGDALADHPAELLGAPGLPPGHAVRMVFHLARSGWRPGADAAHAIAGLLHARLEQLNPVELTQALQVGSARWAGLSRGRWCTAFYTTTSPPSCF